MAKYCKSCGSKIPSGQSGICSMCYGDMAWGSDNYYRDLMREESERERQREQEEQP